MDRLQSLKVRTPGAIVPDKLKCKLTFQDVQNYRLYAGATDTNGYRYQMNGAYDIDPTIGGTTMPGFAEMTLLYKYYRVHGAAWKVQLVNREAFPVVVGTIPLNSDPGVGIVRSQAQNFIMNPYCKWKTLSPTGGMDRSMIKGFISTRKLVGSNSTILDDTYAALCTTNPGNLTFLSLFGYTVDGSNFTVGVDFIFSLTLYIEFYERNYLSS